MFEQSMNYNIFFQGQLLLDFNNEKHLAYYYYNEIDSLVKDNTTVVIHNYLQAILNNLRKTNNISVNET